VVYPIVSRGVHPTSTPMSTTQTDTGSKVIVDNQQIGTGMPGVFSSPTPMHSSLPPPQCPPWAFEIVNSMKLLNSKVSVSEIAKTNLKNLKKRFWAGIQYGESGKGFV